MAGSLKDQLLKSGLVTADRARKLEKEARAEQQARRQGKARGKGKGKGADKPSVLTEAQQRAREINREKAERDRAQMRAIADKAKEKALRAEIKQIILHNDQRVKATSDDVAYNFVHGKRVKRIYVPPAQREQISNGTLVIVNNDGHYHLLPKAAAQKVEARDPKRIIVAHGGDRPQEPGSDDEYYARFQVPDDLDW